MADEIAAIRDSAKEEARVLSGALSSANTVAATDALAGLVADVKGDSRDAVLSALLLDETTTASSLRALTDALLGRAEVALGAIRAVGYRTPARWQVPLAKARETYGDDAVIQGEIAAAVGDSWRTTNRTRRLSALGPV